MPRPTVSVVVVSYNTRDKLRQCLCAIEPEHQVIVVDNASADRSAEMVADEFPSVCLVRSETNLGFGKANNVGMRYATGEVVLFLNSDCYASPGAISALADAFADGVVAVGGRLLNPDRSLQESVAARLTLWSVLLEQLYLDGLIRRIAPRRAYWQTRMALQLGDATVTVEQVMGACLMARPLEMFDERFFLYCEDTDLCRRLREHGRILYVPGAIFTHELGSSSSTQRWKGVARYNRGKELYFAIHHGKVASALCLLLDRLGALLRLLVWAPVSLVSRRHREQPGLFWRVLTCPRRGPTNS